MTIRQLIYLKTIAVKGSYTLASQELYVTQPALSTAVQQLERELDVPLLIRESGKDVRLTEYGNALLPFIDRVLDALQEGEDTIRSMKTSNSGVVKVMLSYASSFSSILSMLKDFMAVPDNKRISIQTIVMSDRAEAVKALNNGTIDLAFFGSQVNEDVNAAPVTPDTVMAIVNKDHSLAGRAFLTIEDLQDETIITYAKGSRFHNWLSDLFAQHDFAPSVMRRADNWSDLVSEIILFNGIAITPQVLVDENYLVAIPFSHKASPWRTHVLWAKDKRLSNAAAQVRDFCIHYYSTQKAALSESAPQ